MGTTIYVNPTGTGDGSARDNALGSLQAAHDVAVAGDLILAVAGTYNEAFLLTRSGRKGARITLARDKLGGAGTIKIDGAGHANAFRTAGGSWWTFEDLEVVNDGGDGSAFTSGVYITSTTGLHGGKASHHLTFRRISVHDVNRSAGSEHYSYPFVIYNPSDVDVGGTECHHIVVEDFEIRDSDTHDYGGETLFELPLLTYSGSIRDWVFRRGFVSTDNLLGYGLPFGINGLEFGDDVGANPAYPYKGVFRQVRFSGGAADMGLFRTRQILSVGCLMEDCTNVAFEAASENAAATKGGRYWHVGNTTRGCPTGFAAGTFDTNWYTTEDVWVTHCHFEVDVAAPDYGGLIFLPDGHSGEAGVIGDSLFGGNVVKSPGHVLRNSLPPSSTMRFEQNAYLTDAADAFFADGAWGDFPYSATRDATSAKYPLATDVSTLPVVDVGEPSWVRHGTTFGDYEPFAYFSERGDLILRWGTMDFIVETGDGVDGANAYADLSAVREYLRSRGALADWDGELLTAEVTASASFDEISQEAHGYQTGDGPATFSSDDALPGGIVDGREYWIVAVDADSYKLAESYADAVATSPVTIDITDAGSGTHTVSHPDFDAQRAAIVRATDYIEQVWGARFGTTPVSTTQGLRWPSSESFRQVRAECYEQIDGVPAQVVKACAEYALRAIAAPLADDRPDGPVTHERVQDGPTEREVTYGTGGAMESYPAADRWLTELAQAVFAERY